MVGLRTALFIDYENLLNALKLHPSSGAVESSSTLRLDVDLFFRSIHQRYGNLDPEDVVVVGDFRKHSRQSTGLSRKAHLVDINTYEARPRRSLEAQKSGIKALARNAGNVTLAYYVGLHVGRRPADVYLLLTGDSAAAAIADELLRLGKQVTFITPGEAPSLVLTERFNCVPFAELHPFDQVQPVEEPEEAPAKEQASPSEEIAGMLSILHRRYPGSGIPAALLRVQLGTGKAQRLLDRAKNEKLIDLWKDPAGVECASLFRMRMGGKPVLMPVRPGLRQAAEVLLKLAKTAEGSHKTWTRAEWRKVIKEAGGFSSSEAKQWLETLLGSGILRDAALGRPDFRLEKLQRFLDQVAG
jgi:hypothetical protein